MPREKKIGVPRRANVCGCRSLGTIERQPRVRREDVAILVAQEGVTGERHAIVARQGDAARGVPRHVYDRQAADRVAVAQAPVGCDRPEPEDPVDGDDHEAALLRSLLP